METGASGGAKVGLGVGDGVLGESVGRGKVGNRTSAPLGGGTLGAPLSATTLDRGYSTACVMTAPATPPTTAPVMTTAAIVR